MGVSGSSGAAGRWLGHTRLGSSLPWSSPDGDVAVALDWGGCGVSAEPACLWRGDRGVGVDEVEEGRGDEVVEVGVVDRGAEAGAGRDRVEGAVRALFAQVDDAVGEVGAVEAVLEEAGGGAGEADAGVLDVRGPSW